jgi:hypothetical protein
MKILLFVLSVIAVTFVNAGTVASCGSSQAVLEAHEEDFPFSQTHLPPMYQFQPESCTLPNGPFCNFECFKNGRTYHHRVDFKTPSNSFVSNDGSSFSETANLVYQQCKNSFGGCNCRNLA